MNDLAVFPFLHANFFHFVAVAILKVISNQLSTVAVDSCRRFLKKQKKVEPYKEVLLHFFSKISNSPTAEMPGLFRQLQQQLFGAEPPVADKTVLDYFDFKEWIAMKLAGSKK